MNRFQVVKEKANHLVDMDNTMTLAQPTLPDTTDEDYEGFCEVLKHIDTELDKGRWQQGDYVLSAVDRFKGTTYGKGIIKKLSMDTQIPESTLKLRRRMSRFYPPSERETILDEYGINYSIMDVARGAGDTVADVREFLEMHKNDEEVETFSQYKRALRKYLGKPVDTKPKQIIKRLSVVAERTGDAIVFHIHASAIDPDMAELLLDNEEYEISVWESE